ncbi:hypothetical protein SVAN01_04565 [Stagonosporopsis vannaccii]|nr:hypothetical protein SVAN01_04565 [Stagonosporopsis vannaccii]
MVFPNPLRVHPSLPTIMYRFSSRRRKGAAEPVHAPLFLAFFTVQAPADDMPLAAPTSSGAQRELSDDHERQPLR